MKMNGKTVMITGSTDGVGRYVARRLAAEGAKVMIHAVRRSRASCGSVCARSASS
ncbi:SDR family NAD(P)-dependent oxidoreductase [Bradyrhizobium sp.]|uniref:SDR family NAD(P)-dependent oxidoreductase n=1 Tax=Bradyrhizobium sp. TaxID=376 RepID=UPI0039B84B86